MPILLQLPAHVVELGQGVGLAQLHLVSVDELHIADDLHVLPQEVVLHLVIGDAEAGDDDHLVAHVADAVLLDDLFLFHGAVVVDVAADARAVELGAAEDGVPEHQQHRGRQGQHRQRDGDDAALVGALFLYRPGLFLGGRILGPGAVALLAHAAGKARLHRGRRRRVLGPGAVAALAHAAGNAAVPEGRRLLRGLFVFALIAPPAHAAQQAAVLRRLRLFFFALIAPLAHAAHKTANLRRGSLRLFFRCLLRFRLVPPALTAAVPMEGRNRLIPGERGDRGCLRRRALRLLLRRRVALAAHAAQQAGSRLFLFLQGAAAEGAGRKLLRVLRAAMFASFHKLSSLCR